MQSANGFSAIGEAITTHCTENFSSKIDIHQAKLCDKRRKVIGTKMNVSAETRRSPKVGKKIHRTSPRVPSKRRREKFESVPVSNKSLQDEKEQCFNFRGNVVQEIWVATQRTVKLIKPENGNRTQGVGEEETDSEHAKDIVTNEALFSSIGCIARKGIRNTPNERKSHFQVVMSELKSKTKTKNNGRDTFAGRFSKEKESPTAIHGRFSSGGEERQETIGGPLHFSENAFLESPEQGTPGNIKTWLSKAVIFQKGSPASERFQFASTQHPKRPFLTISPGNRSTRAVNGTQDLMEEGNHSGPCGTCRREGDIGSHPRKENMLIRPFRRKGAFEVLRRSRSVGNFSFQLDQLFDDRVDFEPIDQIPDRRLVTQIQELLRVLDVSETHLSNLRIQGERNTFELRSEIRRLNHMVISTTHTQELRYGSLIDSIHENYRTLGQVESGFDYFLTLMNREKRSSIRHRFSRCIWFFLDHTVASLLTIVYVTTSIYSHYRFKRGVKSHHAGT